MKNITEFINENKIYETLAGAAVVGAMMGRSYDSGDSHLFSKIKDAAWYFIHSIKAKKCIKQFINDKEIMDFIKDNPELYHDKFKNQEHADKHIKAYNQFDKLLRAKLGDNYYEFSDEVNYALKKYHIKIDKKS